MSSFEINVRVVKPPSSSSSVTFLLVFELGGSVVGFDSAVGVSSSCASCDGFGIGMICPSDPK